MALRAKDKCNSAMHQLKIVSPIAENKTKNTKKSRCTAFRRLFRHEQWSAIHNVLYKTVFIQHLHTFSLPMCAECAYGERYLKMRCTTRAPRVVFSPNVSRRLRVCFAQVSFSILVIFPLQIFFLL